MLVIRNGKIFTMAGEVYDSGCIFVEKNKIKEVLPGNGDLKIAEYGIKKENIIDAENLWVFPGFIDAHCHVGLVAEKHGEQGDDCNEIYEPLTPYLRGIDGINPFDPAFHAAIQAGITSVMTGPGSSNVVGGQFAFIKTHGRTVEEMLVLEHAGLKVSFGENVKNNYGNLSKMPSSRMSIAALLRKELYKAVDYRNLKRKAIENDELFEVDFDLEPYLPVLEKKVPLKAHVHRADDIMTAIRIGKEFDVLITLDHCTEGHLVAEEILKAGYPANIGPDMTSRNKIELYNMDFKTAGILEKKGIPVSVISDHPVTLIQYLPICAALAVKKGMSVESALKAITINPAKICNVSHRVGSLERGKDADIVIFSGNPLEIFTDTVYTIINGKVVYHKNTDES